ncbi:hypothetical protein BGZ96_000043 [Linnemannia gamsii]|uniref:DJ-1/PfpI domain-containing protein n=1 Tax=Linnemannia gamsii TaxID=64522 RepID=A0ABQ7KI07_9FUNG|nr:hypothetical protein BGZ96_000026 [Linnemannia gamsii]KAG0299040.1 hypothetical protein BGZ96_000043 [Linnemannia gamsii]
MSPTAAPHGPLPKIPKGLKKIKLGALVFDEVDLLDVMGPMRIFGEESNTLDIEICFVSTTFEPVRTSQQVTITPKYLVSDTAQKYDLFFIPGGLGNLDYVKQDDLMAYVKTHIEQSTWTMTVCTGAGLLAKTGLIDGYNVTTNKQLFEWPMSQGPKVNWIKRARWVQDGKYVTASGVSAGIDAALFIISEFTSVEVADAVATHIEYTWHRVANEDPFADTHPFTRSG